MTLVTDCYILGRFFCEAPNPALYIFSYIFDNLYDKESTLWPKISSPLRDGVPEWWFLEIEIWLLIPPKAVRDGRFSSRLLLLTTFRSRGTMAYLPVGIYF